MITDKMTPKEIAKELYDTYNINYGSQHFEAKSYASKVLHITALANDMSYREFYEINKEIEQL